MGSPEATCRIFWASPIAPATAPHLVDLLDAHESERMGRFRRPADQALYLSAHALTRVVLGARLDLPAATLAFDRTCRCGRQHGKPTLLHPGAPAFSFTHSGEVVGLAVHDTPVGLDVEQLRPLTDLRSMAEHACSPAELAAGAGTTEATFFSTWTRKEAVLKATGDGLSVPMRSVTLEPSRVREWSGDGDPGTPMWVHQMAPVPGYVAAVAGFGERVPPVVEEDGATLLR